MNSKKIVLPLIALAVFGAAAISVGKVNAQTSGSGYLSGLSQMIAQKFNLDQNQVQDTINQYRLQQRQKFQQHSQETEDQRLNDLVQQGKITNDQKQAIINELNTLRNKYGAIITPGMTPQERRTQRQNELNELRAWAQSQGINIQYVIPRMGIGLRKIRWMGAMNKPSTTPSPSPTQ